MLPATLMNVAPSLLWGQSTVAIPMRPLLDFRAVVLLGVVLTLLGIAYGVGQYLQRQSESLLTPAVVKSFNRRKRRGMERDFRWYLFRRVRREGQAGEAQEGC